eukprot:5789185-Alexandrium_andersonii.AAC.1
MQEACAVWTVLSVFAYACVVHVVLAMPAVWVVHAEHAARAICAVRMVRAARMVRATCAV